MLQTLHKQKRGKPLRSPALMKNKDDLFSQSHTIAHIYPNSKPNLMVPSLHLAFIKY